MRIYSRSNLGFAIFSSLPILFFALFGNFGLDSTDRGFLPGLAYRILSGEVIYRDFFYVRPPLSPYLHTIEMWLFPANLELAAYRFVYYLFIWLSVYWTIKGLMRFFDFQQLGISPWIFGSIAFLLSIGNNMVGPWHTVDGLFFSALGFYLIGRSNAIWEISTGLFSLGLAAFCKQPFAVVPVMGFFFILLNFGFKKAVISSIYTILAATAILLVIEFILSPGFDFLPTMMSQISGSTNFSDLKWAGILLYIRPTALVLVLGVGTWLIFQKLLKNNFSGQILAGLYFLGVASISLGMVWISFQANQFTKPAFGFYHALNGLAMSLALLMLIGKDRRKAGFLLLMLSASWAGGISWGFPYPVYFSTPALFTIAWILCQKTSFGFKRYYWPSLLGISLIGMLLLNQYVYSDAPRSAMTTDAGEIYPELSHIKTSQETFEEFAQFKLLQTKHGNQFTVLPGFSFAHYLSHAKPILPVDLAHDAELSKKGGIDQMIKILNSTPQNYVIATRAELSHANSTGNYRCSTLAYVIDNWTIVDSTAQFYVYKHI